MTHEQALALNPGNKVFWNDPDGGICSRILNIARITYRGDAFEIVEPTGDTVCVYANELSELCPMCEPYGRPGWLINAGQWIPCWRCNPGNQQQTQNPDAFAKALVGPCNNCGAAPDQPHDQFCANATDSVGAVDGERDITLLPHIIIIGNIGQGFEFYGPFPNFLEAARIADEDGHLPEGDWWIAPIYAIPEAGI